MSPKFVPFLNGIDHSWELFLPVVGYQCATGIILLALYLTVIITCCYINNDNNVRETLSLACSGVLVFVFKCGIWVHISRAGERVKTKVRTYREKVSGRYLGEEVNKQDLKRERDGAWEGQHGMIRRQNKRRYLTCLCVLYGRRGQCSSSPHPTAVKRPRTSPAEQPCCRPGAAVPSRGRAEQSRHVSLAARGCGLWPGASRSRCRKQHPGAPASTDFCCLGGMAKFRPAAFV